MLMQHFPRGVAENGQAGAFPDAAWSAHGSLQSHGKWKFKDGAVLVGRIGNAPIGLEDDRHIMTIAGSRSGKGRSSIIPNMCLYPGVQPQSYVPIFARVSGTGGRMFSA